MELSIVSALQTAVSTRLAQWSDAFASTVLDQVQDLPHWGNVGIAPPETLTDLVHPRTAVSFIFNPHFAQTVCRIIGVDARSVIGRETRSDRLLQDLNTVDMTLTDCLHAVPGSRVVFLLQKYPGVRLFITRQGRGETRVPPSLISILLMAVKKGENVTFRAEGEGAAEVLRQIRGYNDVEWFAADRRRSRVEIREIHGAGVGSIVPQILEAMRHFDMNELSAVYHPETRRLIVGGFPSTHKEIAKSAGFTDPDSYNRLNFDARGEHLQATFGPGKDEENKAGRDWLQEWLADLFRGVRVYDVKRS